MLKFIKNLFKHKNTYISIRDGLPRKYAEVIIKRYKNGSKIPMLISCYRVTEYNADLGSVNYWHCTCGTMKDKLIIIDYKDKWKYV